MEVLSEGADYGKLAYLRIDELFRRVLYLEAEVKRLKGE